MTRYHREEDGETGNVDDEIRRYDPFAPRVLLPQPFRPESSRQDGEQHVGEEVIDEQHPADENEEYPLREEGNHNKRCGHVNLSQQSFIIALLRGIRLRLRRSL